MKNMRTMMVFGTLVAACDGSAASGNLHVEVEAEETIAEGLTPGTGDENIRDGWTVEYSKFYITLGNLTAESHAESETHVDSNVYVVNLLDVRGLHLAQFEGISAVRYDNVGYDQPEANNASVCAPGTDATDCTTMKTDGYSVWVAGTMTKQSESRAFEFRIKSGVRYSECASPDEMLGIAVATGGDTESEATIHGDHWFFTRYPTGDEATQPIYRCAGWLARVADTDSDSVITETDLRAASAVDVFPTTAGGDVPTECVFSLGGFAFGAVTNAWDYVVQQSMTLGHFQGEGDCVRTAL